MSYQVTVNDLGQLIDRLYLARAKRLALDKKVEALKAEEAVAKQQIIDLMREAKLASASGRKATATPTVKRRYSVGDWKKYWAWASKDAGGNYVQKRVAAEAVSEYLAANPKKTIPGLEWMDDRDVSLTKVAAKKGG